MQRNNRTDFEFFVFIRNNKCLKACINFGGIRDSSGISGKAKNRSTEVPLRCIVGKFPDDIICTCADPGDIRY